MCNWYGLQCINYEAVAKQANNMFGNEEEACFFLISKQCTIITPSGALIGSCTREYSIHGVPP
jgi:hypothetical protein